MWGGKSVGLAVSNVLYSSMLVVNRWLSARFNLLSSAVVGITALVAVLSPGIDASLAGFALSFATSLLHDVSP